MRVAWCSARVLVLCMGAGVWCGSTGVFATKPDKSDWNGHSSLAASALGHLFSPDDLTIPWDVNPRFDDSQPGPTCGLDTDEKTDQCCQFITDDNKSAACCIGTHQVNGAWVPDVDYGTCKSSSNNNCPGSQAAFCNTGANPDSTHGGGSCPEYVTFGNPPTTVYPRCQLASADCQKLVDNKGNPTGKCWGVIKCFSDPGGSVPASCPPGGFTDFNSRGASVVYHEGDFCYEDGNSDNTKWCGNCPAGTTFSDSSDKKDQCLCPNNEPVDSSGSCCPGVLDVNEACCPSETSVLDQNLECCAIGNVDISNLCCPAGTGIIPPQVTCCLIVIDQGVRKCGGSTTHGDPQIGGFQGQSFQFHGLADEVFNLISTPSLQLNGRFVYLSSGKCDYNDTQCWSHPGTYIDQLGFSFGGHRVKVIAGPHRIGMHISMDGEKLMTRNYHFKSNGTDVTIHFKHHGVVTITTHQFIFTIYNSDTFFNVEASMLDQQLLRIGEPKHTITDSSLCHKEESLDETQLQGAHIRQRHNHGAVEAAIDAKYGGAQVPLHGLIGQTWRNVLVCGKHWVGSVTDYLASDLFATDYVFNFYLQE